MHIEVFKGTQTPRQGTADTIEAWFWHFKNGNKITADSEAFPRRANAIRAAKAVVVATVKELDAENSVEFASFSDPKNKDVLKIVWW